MPEDAEQRDERGRVAPDMRLEATVHEGEVRLSLERVADLDLDRIPDPDGGVRVLVSIEDAVRLVEQGYEVHLLRALPVTPLDPSLVIDDDAARTWLEDRVEGIERGEGE